MNIGITLGDPSGIGPEIILKAVPEIKENKKIFIFGNKNILKKTARDLRIVKHYKAIEKNIVNCVENINFQYGKPTKSTADAALQSIDSALQYNPDIIITPPIVKDAIRHIIPDFVGHTEYLAKFFRTKNFGMVGLSKKKKIMLLTTHLPLRHIFKEITPFFIAKKIILFNWGLKKYFGLRNPTIGVCALNPHAFEFSLGEEEKIEKAITKAQKRGINVEGPYPADSIFDRNFDGFLAMFHDQAMIYLKSKKNGLNFTLGLPVIRLSPLHGTALDIAGKNMADSSGLITAVNQGINILKNARRYERKNI